MIGRVARRIVRSVRGPDVVVTARDPRSVPDDRHSSHLRFDTADVVVAEAIRDHVRAIGRRGRMLDVGGGVGAQRSFAGPLEHWVLDLEDRGYPRTLVGDACARIPAEDGSFDVVYSNNTLEHLPEPWITAAEVGRVLRPGGICCTVTWFAIRYHPVPGDYWRFSHSALELLFEKHGGLETVASGYDAIPQ